MTTLIRVLSFERIVRAVRGKRLLDLLLFTDILVICSSILRQVCEDGVNAGKFTWVSLMNLLALGALKLISLPFNVSHRHNLRGFTFHL